MISKEIKILLLVGSCFMSFIYALTSPIVQIYFMRLVEPNILALANFITIGLAAIVNSTVPNDKIKAFYHRNFKGIVIIDVVCFVIISLDSVKYVTLRFIGFSVLNAVSTNLWCIMLGNAVNQVMSGDRLTDWNAYKNSLNLWFSFVGVVLAMIFTNIDINLCIALQCIANIVLGFTDILAFNKLKKIADSK